MLCVFYWPHMLFPFSHVPSFCYIHKLGCFFFLLVLLNHAITFIRMFFPVPQRFPNLTRGGQALPVCHWLQATPERERDPGPGDLTADTCRRPAECPGDSPHSHQRIWAVHTLCTLTIRVPSWFLYICYCLSRTLRFIPPDD